MTEPRHDEIETTSRSLGTTASTIKDRAATTIADAREHVRDSAEAAREKALDGYSAARAKTSEGIDDAPLVALVGGAALGLLAGVLLPRSRREADMLEPIALRIGDAAREAATAARAAGRDTLDELGINTDAARETVSRLVENAGNAAAASVNRKQS